MKPLLLAAILAATLLARATPSHADSLADYLGAWKITHIADYADVSSIESDKALGGAVQITSTSIVTPAFTCDKHRITFTSPKNADIVLREAWDIPRSGLSLGPLTLPRTTGYLDATCIDALVLDHNDLLMSSGDGAFYVIHRINQQ
jgi:hypothetical protein